MKMYARVSLSFFGCWLAQEFFNRPPTIVTVWMESGNCKNTFELAHSVKCLSYLAYKGNEWNEKGY